LASVVTPNTFVAVSPSTSKYNLSISRCVSVMAGSGEINVGTTVSCDTWPRGVTYPMTCFLSAYSNKRNSPTNAPSRIVASRNSAGRTVLSGNRMPAINGNTMVAVSRTPFFVKNRTDISACSVIIP
jgi:hypothetical protein